MRNCVTFSYCYGFNMSHKLCVKSITNMSVLESGGIIRRLTHEDGADT